MRFDGFDMILNGCITDMISVYQDKDKRYFQFTARQENPGRNEEFCALLSRDELVELKTRLSMLLDFVE